MNKLNLEICFLLKAALGTTLAQARTSLLQGCTHPVIGPTIVLVLHHHGTVVGLEHPQGVFPHALGLESVDYLAHGGVHIVHHGSVQMAARAWATDNRNACRQKTRATDECTGNGVKQSSCIATKGNRQS